MEGPLVLPEAMPKNGSGASIKPEAIVEYITDVLYATLGATKSELQSHANLLSHEIVSDTLRKCAKFSQESQTALYIQQVLNVTEAAKQVNEVNGASGKNTKYFFHYRL